MEDVMENVMKWTLRIIWYFFLMSIISPIGFMIYMFVVAHFEKQKENEKTVARIASELDQLKLDSQSKKPH